MRSAAHGEDAQATADDLPGAPADVPRMTEAPGRSWVDVVRWVWDVFGTSITTAFAAVLQKKNAL
jgi:hypothetical protein